MCDSKYVPQVGDRIRGSWWDKHDLEGWLDVKATGEVYMIVVNQNGVEHTAQIEQHGGHWVKVTKPTPCPERVWNVYVDGVGGAYLNDTYADRNILPERIGKMYLHVDGTCEFIRTEVLS